MTRLSWQKIILILGDLVSMFCAFLFAILITKIYHEDLLNSPVSNFFNPGVSKFLGLFVIAIFWYQDHYIKRRPFWEELLQIVRVSSLLLLINLGIAFVLGKGSLKILVISFWLSNICILPFIRLIAKRALYSCGLWQRDLFIIGFGNTALQAYELFAKNKSMGYRLVAFVDVVNGGKTQFGNLPTALMSEEQFLDKIAKDGECDVIVGLSNQELNANLKLVNYLQHNCLSLLVLPEISGLALYGAEVDHFFGNDQLVLRLKTNLSKKINRVFKRSFDLIAVIIILIIISPFMFIIALLIKRSSKSKVFFLHQRVGKNGRPFPCIKFQTMYPNSKELLEQLLASDPIRREEWQQSFKLKDDPRVTPIGKFLRATSLDELPQLFNVLLGQMSLVGPRPIVLDEVERYQDGYYYYQLVLPGITGLWQVSGRSDVDYVNRVRLDEWYVKNWSLWYDIVILLKTFGVVLKRTGAY